MDYVIGELYSYYSKNLEHLPENYYRMLDRKDSKDTVVTDYIAGMTDRYIINIFKDNFIPDSWGVR